MIPRIAPVSREMIFSYIAERVLGQKKSYYGWRQGNTEWTR
jgi:acyl-CoA dehydrogenase